MKRTVLIAVALALVIFATLGTVALAQGPIGGTRGGGMMGGGMMGGYGPTQSQTITPTVPYGYGWSWDNGMMGRSGYGSNPTQSYMSTVPYGYGCGGMMGGGMMGGWGYNAPGAKAITLDQAVTSAQNYVTALNNPDLRLVEIEEYTGNFFAVVAEKSTGINAFQVLANKYNGTVSPEMGPNMMWNTKYSPMARMMGGFWYGQPSGPMTVSVAQARANAAQYLKTSVLSATLEDATDTFYGYYNIDVLVNGKTYGMLSVNGYTGAVWYHTWHGDFIQAKELP